MHKEQLEDTLEEILPEEGDKLVQRARYSIEGGKRLRPLLTLAVVDAFEIPIEKALYPACAIELIHTYSMIHDDLPCMDDDELRRGRLTLHKAYSESDAVLTGDFLLTYAFEIISTSPHLSDQQKNALVFTLATRSGLQGMIGGQVVDIEDETLEMDDLFAMYRKKTGALITAALEFGAIIAKQDVGPFIQIGDLLGLAFQIVDDILDNDGIAVMLGKERSKEIAESLYADALFHIKQLPKPAPLLIDLAESMVFRNV